MPKELTELEKQQLDEQINEDKPKSWMNHLTTCIKSVLFNTNFVRCTSQEDTSGHIMVNAISHPKNADNGDVSYVMIIYCQSCGKTQEISTGKIGNKTDMLADINRFGGSMPPTTFQN